MIIFVIMDRRLFLKEGAAGVLALALSSGKVYGASSRLAAGEDWSKAAPLAGSYDVVVAALPVSLPRLPLPVTAQKPQ